MTRSPCFHLGFGEFTSRTSPETSKPKISEAPGGGGYAPFRREISARFKAVAFVFMRI